MTLGLAVGDKVMFKTHGPIMTVVEVPNTMETNPRVMCGWFDQRLGSEIFTYVTERLPIATLEKVNPGGTITAVGEIP